ncbi:MAG: hypothetical protein JOY58_03995 [Solirubrobacterales bacterium]|nr:hypothetical protein [Solirubrobacterales bacterium]
MAPALVPEAMPEPPLVAGVTASAPPPVAVGPPVPVVVTEAFWLLEEPRAAGPVASAGWITEVLGNCEVPVMPEAVSGPAESVVPAAPAPSIATARIPEPTIEAGCAIGGASIWIALTIAEAVGPPEEVTCAAPAAPVAIAAAVNIFATTPVALRPPIPPKA